MNPSSKGPSPLLAVATISALLQLHAPMQSAAQSVVVPDPESPAPTTSRTSGSGSRSGSSGPDSAPAGAASAAPSNPFQWGPVTAHPRVNYRFTYGSGLQSSPGNSRSSIIQSIGAGLRLDLGQIWNVDYSPRLTIYSDSAFENTVNHSAALRGQTQYQDWTLLALSQTVAITSDPSTETGRQTDQERYATSVSATYQVNSDLSLDFGVNQQFQFASGADLQNSRQWATMNWLNYHWGANLSLGLGAGAGFLALDGSNTNSSDLVYEQLQGRVRFQLTDKISLSINAGGEFRQFLDSERSSLLDPVFGASIYYQPFEFTSVSLAANRAIRASQLSGQVSENTTLSAGIRQRFLGRYYASLSGGFSNTRYIYSASASGVNREDNYYYVRTSLNTAFLRRGTASVFYSHSENTSDATGLGYSSDQIGFQVGYSY